jgi:integral membrane sensor domain MASE1
VRDVVTTLLEVFGFAAIAVGAGLEVGQWSTPGGAAVGGIGLIAAATLIERPWQRVPAAVDATADGEGDL